MSDTFQNGGTNSTTQTYTASVTVNPSSSNTLTNTKSGQLLFTPPAANTVYIYGNLTNAGIISYIPSTVGSGNTFYLGSGSSNTLNNTGSITYNQSNTTSESSVYLQYGTINNSSSGSITLESAGASTISAPYVVNLTNEGNIRVLDTSGSGMTSNWGNGSGTFNNTGSFSVDDSAGSSGSTTNLNFKQIANSGSVSFSVPAASTIITQVGSGGFANTGNWSIISKGNGAGNIQIQGGSSSYTNNGTINVTDANLIIANALTGSGGTVNLTNNANLTLQGTNTGSGQTFNFSSANNTLNVSNGATFKGIIRGFSQGDQLDLNVTGTATYNKTTGILTINGSSNTYTYDVGKGYTGTFSDSTGGVVTYKGTTPCYLSGSMIRTPDGEKAVEDISVGDTLMSWDNAANSDVTKSVVWVGSKSVVANPSLPIDLAGYPVRILKNALADGIPYQDLLVTAEHCMFLDGKFVPTRMLINGRSIFYDTSMVRFDVFHIETEEHAVLTANGARSESFLNTENHGLSRRNGKIVSINAHRIPTWDDASAPLDVSREFVEPLFHKIESRAGIGECTTQSHQPILTNDPDLHLLTDTGTVIYQARKGDDRVMFMVPTGVRQVRIVSNSGRPSDVIGPFVDDRRELGVLVGGITLFESNETRNIRSHLDNVDLAGWNNIEDGQMRWTTGNAVLPLGERQPNSVAILALQIRAAGPYIVTTPRPQDKMLLTA